MKKSAREIVKVSEFEKQEFRDAHRSSIEIEWQSIWIKTNKKER